ncbi:MAG: 3-oxoacyl-[acyl-carrier-protein] reductase [Candidatus Margulisiibacteriota bacterium]
MKLAGKVAFITGGAQGIGKAIAAEFAAEGATVIISDINLEVAQKTADELSATGAKAKAFKQNVADFEETTKVIEAAAAEFGKIDILINNAGITKDALLIRMKPEEWSAVVSVNLTGVFNCTKAVASIMMKARTGKIVNIASIVGLMGNAGQANYSATKAGVIGFTKTMAKELASRNILVNAIAPGFIDTEMTKKIPVEIQEKMKEQIPLKKLGLPQDIAKAAVFLSSSDSDYITGQVLSVNGGMYM